MLHLEIFCYIVKYPFPKSQAAEDSFELSVLLTPPWSFTCLANYEISRLCLHQENANSEGEATDGS